MTPWSTWRFSDEEKAKMMLNQIYGMSAFENKENKEEEKMRSEMEIKRRREIMNSLKVGDEVHSIDERHRGKNLKILAFDYENYLILCSSEIRGEGHYKITRFWVNPLTLVAGDKKANDLPTPKRIIVNEKSQVTVVLWDDNTKTIVKCSDADTYDPYAAYCAAFAKRCYGTNSKLKKTIEKLTVYQQPKQKKGE